MAVAGSLTYDTKIDKSGFKSGLNGLEKETNNTGTKIKNIVAGLGITKIIGKAFSLISDNMDSAIKRIDTLNNFPKVMSNLGISSEDSTKAINKLSEGLKGIPTKLDDASLAVQRFTSINNDVNKSTDYFLAFNNALLAGGASAEIQSNALEQLSQMYGVGTVDAEAWRSVQTAIPAQLQQVAQSLGYTSTAVGGDFYNAMKSGKISMEQFMDQIVKLNKEGTGQYASFAEQAKSATGGIQTAISNAKTAVSRGVADIIKAIDEGLKNAGFGSISDIISEKGKKIEKVLKTIAEQIPKIIDLVVKNKETLMDLAKIAATTGAIFEGWKIASVIQGVVKGFQEAKVALALYSMQIDGTNIAHGVFNGTLTVGETIVGLLTGKIKLAELATAAWSKAQTLLNAVMKANPIALVVTAIGLLVAGFIYLWNTSEGFRNFWIGLWEGIKSAASNAWNAIADFFTKTIPDAINSVVDSFKNLPQKIYEVFWDIFQPIEDTFWNFYEKITAIVEETIKNVIDTLKNWGNNIATFFTETIPQLWSGLIDWFTNLPYNIGYALGFALGSIIQWGTNVWNYLVTNVPIWIDNIGTFFSELPGKIWDWLLQVIESIGNWGQQMWDSASTTVSNMINDIGNYFSQLPGLIWSWLLETIAKITIWGIEMYVNSNQALIEFLSNVINYFSQLPGNIWNWLVKTIEKVGQWGKEMAEKGKTAALDLFNNIVNKIKEIPGKMLEIGKNIVEGIWNGITGAGKWIGDKISSFCSGITDGFKDALGIHSPSRVLRDKVGQWIPKGVAVGITTNTDSVDKAIDEMNNGIVAKMNRAVNVEAGRMSANAIVRSNANYNQAIYLNANFDGSVDIDGKKAGRILAPAVCRTIKAGGFA